MPPFSPGANALMKTSGSAATAGVPIRATAARARAAECRRSVIIADFSLERSRSLTWSRVGIRITPPPGRVQRSSEAEGAAMSRSILTAAVLLASAPLAGAAEKPNFVFMFADDQRYDAMSVVQKEQGDKGRFPWFATPNMDRIAAEGVRFRNAFVVNALCSPSRACFLSGKYSHANGIWDNRTPLDEKLVTYASLLRANGYSSGYVGKWHMDGATARPGFDWYASFVGQGTYTGANFLVNGKAEKADAWTDDRSGDYAVRFLEKERAKDKPFVLV